MQANKEEDPSHIDYIIPGNNPEKKMQYSQFIARECHLRGIGFQGTQLDE
jgi:ribosomal protein S2